MLCNFSFSLELCSQEKAIADLMEAIDHSEVVDVDAKALLCGARQT